MSQKIDLNLNLNILDNNEFRMTGNSINNYVGLKASYSTSSPGYSLILPSTQGNPGDYLSINSTGSGEFPKDLLILRPCESLIIPLK